MATASAKPVASLGGASVEIQESCPHCTAGFPIPIAGDENGTTYKCLACGYGYGVPATPADRAKALAEVSPELSASKLRALARANGIEPDDYGSTEQLHAAMVQAGEKAMKGKS